MNQHPHLKTLHTLYTEEAQPFRKVHRMIDLFESIIKSHTVVIIAEYVRHNQLSDTAKGLLAQGLRTPSLGTWQLFSRVLFEELQAVNYAWTLNEFASGFEFLDKSLNNDKTNVIAFRNGYAHGATPSDEQCENDIRKFEPYLDKLLSLRWVEQSSIEVNEGIVYVQSEVNSLCCHPIFLFRDENNEASFAFFNDLKNDKIGLLNYPLGKHYREKEFFKVFHEYLPLNEWKKSGNNEFYQRIEELTETFKGRTFEREKLLQFVLNETKGYCSIQGNPGIGKSALIAQFFKDLRASEKAKNVNVVEYFIRRGTAQAQTEYLLNYLIKRTDELFPQGKEVRAEGKMVFEIQQQLFNKWRLWAEHSNGKKLLFLIDGLDEGVENNIVSYLPRENFQDILIIYGSRPGGHKTIDELWATLPFESHSKIELSGLSKEDIRALIYEVSNKYDLEKDSEWIEAVQKRSQGNPLYLKLLCDSIENGGIALNDVNALPSKIDEYYKAILLRYAQDPDGVALLAGLYTFAAAKDYLTMSHLGLMNQLGDATLERIGSTLKEVLYENPLTEDVLDYQLFHESFREYLVKEKTLKVNEAKQRIIEFCGRWKELEGQWEQRYVLEHYASHLHESIKEQHSDLLLKLIYDTDFQSTQKKVLRGFESTNTLFRLALLKASDIKRFDEQLEAGLCLVDLKYEEANDAPQIVAMVASGEIDLALKRIESFGGSDKEGIQRKFILYMLCLMELTLLESKDKPFRKDAIQKLLDHLDEQIPPDTSLINWSDFFPSNLMFQMSCELAEIGLDYSLLYIRTESWESDWMSEKSPFSSKQIQVLIDAAHFIENESEKSIALIRIAVELAKQGQIEESLYIARGISDYFYKSNVLKNISFELRKNGRIEESALIIQESLVSARGIGVEWQKSRALLDISIELSNQGNLEVSASVFEESLALARCISKDDLKLSRALKDIAVELSKRGQVEASALLILESQAIARSIIDEGYKIEALITIAAALANQGQLSEALSLIRESLAIARSMHEKWQMSFSLSQIAEELYNIGQVFEASSLMQESLTIALSDNHIILKTHALSSISLKLFKQGQVKKSLAIVRSISSDVTKNSTLRKIAIELFKHEQLEEAKLMLQESLYVVQGKVYEYDTSAPLTKIAVELVKKGKVEESLIIARNSCDNLLMSRALRSIALELRKQDRMEESSLVLNEWLVNARCIGFELMKNFEMKAVATELSKQGKVKESLTIAQSISDDRVKCDTLTVIFVELSKQGKLEESESVMKEALTIAHDISEELEKIDTLIYVSDELGKLGQLEESSFLLRESIAIALGVNDERKKYRVWNDISVLQCKQGYLEESLVIGRGISDDFYKSSALKDISLELRKQGNIEVSLSVMQESLTIARGISDGNLKSAALKNIAIELAKQGDLALAESVALEIIQLAERHNSWKTIAQNVFKETDWQKSLQQNTQFKSDEARLFYLKGWANAVNECDADCVQEALSQLAHDSESVESILQSHALHEIFFGAADQKKFNRLNRTLNIQWALDIVAQFPKEESSSRLSTNLELWLHEIADEDDRDQIELWAKQVAKGKITEEEFAVKMKVYK